MNRFVFGISLALGIILAGNAFAADKSATKLSLIVMDPLAAPLSCPCVEGYAQRKYEVLAKHLQSSLGRDVELTFGESLPVALKKANGKVDIVIGKQSVVMADAKAAQIHATPISRLSDQQGLTTQYGMIVVNKGDPAEAVGDLTGYTIIFGPAEAEEKHSAALAILNQAGIKVPKQKRKINAACSDGACKVIDLGPTSKTAAVISSYAQPLLEGCGTIKKGDLRVVAKTSPVPFVTVFVTASVDADSREQVQSALTDVASHPDILAALESLLGFLPIEESMTVTKKELTRGVVFQFDDDSDRSQAGISRVSWPGWRGPNRDGRVPWLPDLLGFESNVLWEIPIAHAGLGGIAATERYVVFGDRDIDDFNDVFRCLDAASGETIWEVERLAIAALDYGNTPRGTPLISGDCVFCVGAHGHLLCIRLADGVVVWEKNFRDDFPLKVELPWGYCGSPLLVEDKLIVAPGALDASLIALDRATGEIIWKSPGGPPSYGSLNVGVLGGVQQVVGHDATTLGGWDVKSGERLWKMSPDNDGDFNVPTPIIDRGTLIVVTENNGARRFQFDQSGRIIDRPIAVNPKLRAEMSTPVLVGERLFCVDNYLYCLEVDTLDEQWRLRDRALGDYGAIIASEQRLLVIAKGELLLLGTDGDQQILGRQRVFDEKVNLYSHPAIVGNKLYVRGESRLKCLGL